LRDLKACTSQFLVVNPGYHPAEAAKVLTRAGQLKKCICRSLSKRLSPHSVCIYICYSLASNGICFVMELETYLGGRKGAWGSSFSATTWIAGNGVAEERNWILDVSSASLTLTDHGRLPPGARHSTHPRRDYFLLS
jgi:hypothetical protein